MAAASGQHGGGERRGGVRSGKAGRHGEDRVGKTDGAVERADGAVASGEAASVRPGTLTRALPLKHVLAYQTVYSVQATSIMTHYVAIVLSTRLVPL